MQKLKRALEALGEDSGPEYQVLLSSLKKAKAAAQGVPIGVQLEQSLKFVERSEKRLRVLDEERANEASLLTQAKQRVEWLRSELVAGMDCQEVPPTFPCNFAEELAQLRACVFELQMERDDLRAKLQNSGDREDRERKQPRTLASPALDLVPLNRNTIDRTVVMGGQLQGGGQSSASVRMETLIENADSSLRSGSRFNPLSS